MLPPLAGAGEFLIRKLTVQQIVEIHAHAALLKS